MPIQLRDIQQPRDANCIGLFEQILLGLSCTPPHLPSLLLWNDEGLDLFDALTQSPSYYLHDKEMEILRRHASEMAKRIPSGSALIELGCGSLRKTGEILSALERQNKSIDYYALDVSPGELGQSLASLESRLGRTSQVRVHGLVGTYEDCIQWLAHKSNHLHFPQSTSLDLITFLWMGNSMANYSQTEASSVLNQFVDAMQKTGRACQFLVGIDGCQDENRIMKAYNNSQEVYQSFIMNGLRHANLVMETETFLVDDAWTCTSKFDAEERALKVFYLCKKDTELVIFDGSRIPVQKEFAIEAIRSGKWSVSDVQAIVKQAGLRVDGQWCDSESMYWFYAFTTLI